MFVEQAPDLLGPGIKKHLLKINELTSLDLLDSYEVVTRTAKRVSQILSLTQALRNMRKYEKNSLYYPGVTLDFFCDA